MSGTMDSPRSEMEETGERMIPAHHKGMLIYGEHIARYRAAASLAADKDVLDVASGSGYGTKMLAEIARHVTGVDNSADAIAFSKKHYNRSNISYKLGDAAELPVSDSCMDLVVSLETIEHIPNYRLFLSELKRILRPGGQAVISTPNNSEFPDGNHFHTHQFEVEEFEKLLKSQFKNVVMYYQSDWQFTAVLPLNLYEQEWQSALETAKTTLDPAKNCVYMVAVCSDSLPATLPPFGAISQPMRVRAQIERKQLQTQTKDGLREALSETEAELARVQRALNAVLSSKSWRYTQMVRSAKNKLTKKKR